MNNTETTAPTSRGRTAVAGPSRRAVVTTAAWSAPVVAVALATPAAAASTPATPLAQMRFSPASMNAYVGGYIESAEIPLEIYYTVDGEPGGTDLAAVVDLTYQVDYFRFLINGGQGLIRLKTWNARFFRGYTQYPGIEIDPATPPGTYTISAYEQAAGFAFATITVSEYPDVPPTEDPTPPDDEEPAL